MGKDTLFSTFTGTRNKTLRYFLIILSFCFSGFAQAQMYRVFLNDKGIQTDADDSEMPVPETYMQTIRQYCDSVWMSSAWLNYVLISTANDPDELLKYSFVDRIEKLSPWQPVSMQVEENMDEKDTADPAAIHRHREWQLDTLNYTYFQTHQITGKGIVVAIIDAGFTEANESRAFANIFSTGRVLKTYDFLDNDTNVYHGSTHGTSVWSCVAGNLDKQPTGMATGASFILLRSEDQVTETMADEDRWIQAIEKAYEWGADIVTSSVGFTNALHSRDQVNGQSLISKAADMAASKGMLVVISAGNEWLTLWKTLSIPADAEGVITVGGIDREGNHSYFSSVGPTADGRSKPDVVAPGTCVVVKGNELSMANGTSFAAPLVAGYLACMLEWKGKNNFPKDSIKYYAGLYPYYDYLYGYGVPGVTARDSGRGGLYGFDKSTHTFYLAATDHSPYTRTYENLWVKIVGADGMIKCSKYFKSVPGGKLKITTTHVKNPFNYSKYFDPQDTDRWCIWWNGQYYEF